jgi:hypothetical protein
MLNIYSYCAGLVTTIAVYILALPSLGTEDYAAIIEWIFIILFPNYSIAKSIMDMYTNYLTPTDAIRWVTRPPARPHLEFVVRAMVSSSFTLCCGLTF